MADSRILYTERVKMALTNKAVLDSLKSLGQKDAVHNVIEAYSDVEIYIFFISTPRTWTPTHGPLVSVGAISDYTILIMICYYIAT